MDPKKRSDVRVVNVMPMHLITSFLTLVQSPRSTTCSVALCPLNATACMEYAPRIRFRPTTLTMELVRGICISGALKNHLTLIRSAAQYSNCATDVKIP